MYRHAMLPALLLAACRPSTEDTTVDTGSSSDVFDQVITVTDPATGDFACYSSGDAWLDGQQAVDPTCQVDAPMAGTVEDFDSGDGVANAELDFWFADRLEGDPDLSTVSDASGAVSASALPACQPMSYRVATDPDLDQTKVTIEAHQVYGYPDAGQISDTYNSVSVTTYKIIPSLLGISVDPEAGVVAGTAYDCNGDPIEGAQVIVKDAGGDYPEAQRVRYFVSEFPNPDQPWTSEDGLWVAINVPPGRVTVELWMVEASGADPAMVGSTRLDVFADSINIANVQVGFEGGVVYPSSCLSACGSDTGLD